MNTLPSMVHTPISDSCSFCALAFPTNSLQNAVKFSLIKILLAWTRSAAVASVNNAKCTCFSLTLFVKCRNVQLYYYTFSFHSMANVDVFGLDLNIQRLSSFQNCPFVVSYVVWNTDNFERVLLRVLFQIVQALLYMCSSSISSLC